MAESVVSGVVTRLDADERQNESAFVKNSVKEMKDLAYDAEDVIATYALTVGSRKGRGIQKVLKRIWHNKRINNASRAVGGPSSFNETQLEQRETYSHLQHDVVGFDKYLKELVEFLLKEEEGKRVASICGMGGPGKTTLAQLVYNDHEVKKHFEHRTWAWISLKCQRRLVW
ncbi:hypothetical protein RGQ29_005077 [Quercus rubra]|uniref:NB-ARC domain-containing protein n=1 Tax=Quercus rubra TaxID=3512 RepID=A0AAN7E399_QUERU|nr:hypothetical protein RGQ29_005077 [Quercus rubra]